VFLLEEQSIEEVLKVLLPQILTENVRCQFLAQGGKATLEKVIPSKLRGWNTPDTQFVIAQDKDANDCMRLKEKLRTLAIEGGKPEALIRIVCTELESWFLGDLNAVGLAYNTNISGIENKALYRDPDKIANAKQELKRIVPEYRQIDGSRRIAQYMDIGENRSHSFHVFVDGVRKMCGITNSDQGDHNNANI
jgi:uncharacterized protein YktA (UPF0223 family)